MTSLKDQAWQSGLVLLDETPRWSEDDWPSLLDGWRWRHATVVLDHTVVVLGGCTPNHFGTKSVLVLNLTERSKQWRQGPPMNTSRREHAAVVCNGGIYVVGGPEGESLDCVERIDSNDLLQPLSTSKSTHESHWTKLKCRLSTKRWGCCAVAVHNRYIVVMGGYTWRTTLLTLVEIIDTSNHTVIAGPNMNVPRIWCASAVVGHRIFVVGGEDKGLVEYLDIGKPSDNEERNNTLSTFISSLSGWTTHSDLVLSASRDSCAMVIVGSCLVVAGAPHQTVEILDTHHNRMWNLPPLRNRLENCSMVDVANEVAVIGGRRNPSCATLRLMDKNTWCFRQLCEQPQIEWFHSLERLGNGDVDS